MKKLVLMWIALLAFGVSFGQSITNYAFSASSGTFTPITGGTAVSTSTSVADFLGDTKTSIAIPIGFTFYYMGVPYTQLVAMSDGYVSFNLSATSSLTNNLATSAATQRPLLAPLWDDLDGASGTGAANYITEGAAGSRVFTIEWLNWQWNYGATGATISFQIKIYETTGKIEFIYSPAGGAINGASASIGITGIPTGAGNYLSLSGSGATPTVSSTAETTTISVLPAAGQVYTFTPPSTVSAPTNLTFTNVGATRMTLNWTDSPDESYYILSNSPDGVTYTPVTNLPANTVTYSATGLTPSTLYYWKITAAVESGFTGDLLGSQSTMAISPLHGLYSINNLFPTTATLQHDGTDNFNNFTDAINVLNDNGISASVIFAVAAGQTFAEDCPAITATGTSTNTIAFGKAGVGANPVITPTGTTGTTDAGIAIYGGDYIAFNEIDISIATGSAVEYGYYITNASATDGAQYNTIRDSKITLNRANTSARGISQYTATSATDASGANSNNIYHKNIVENCYHGIQLTGTSSTYPDLNCVIDSNIVGAATANDIGNGTSAANGIRANYQQDLTIFANMVRNVSTTGAAVYGIYMQYLLGINNNIGNNIVHTIGNSGTTTSQTVYGLRADINSGATANIFNNMVSDLNHGVVTASATNAIRGIATGVTGTGTSNIVHNSVLISEDAAASSAAFYLGGSGIHNVLNNVFANTSTAGATSKRYCIYRTTGATLNSDYNDLYIDAVGTNNFVGYFTADRNTLANWQTASLVDVHSISVDPTFATTTDLHTTNVALNGTGYPIPQITFDIDNDTRDPNFPDMGADENLTPVAFTCTTPTPGNTIASSTALCYGDGVLLTLENATAGTGVTYQWQSSSDGVTYSNIIGATMGTYGTVLSVPTYFQCLVTCYSGPVSGTSTPVLVGFAHEITSSTGASRCGAGTLSLSATATASSTINWYSLPDGGTSIGTGSPWTTPVITATTTYYVAAEGVTSGIVNIGTGSSTSSTYSNPFYSLWSNTHTQHLIKKEELSAAGLLAGNITTLALDFTSAGTLPTIDLSVKIGTTTASDMSAFVDNSLFTVIYTNASYMPTTGINTLVFATPFYWDGNSNIVLEFCHGNSASSATMSRTVKADPTSYVSSVKAHVSSATAASVICPDVTTNLATYSVRPQFIFSGETSCSSPRVEVVATIGASPALTLTPSQSVCNNGIGQIDVTSTLAEYDSYVWTPVTDLYTDATATIPYVGGVSAATVYVKSTTAGTVTYTCTANNAGTGCANIATTDVTIIPTSPVATASPEAICVSGSSVISVNPGTGYGTATFQWMESTDNATFSDIVGANAIDFTTPVISDTMYYKMVVELGASVCTETNVVTINVNNPQVVSTTPATRCGDGTVVLGAEGNAGTTINWYDVAIGGASIGSGNSFTTPVISANTSYYASANFIGLPVTTTIGAGSSTSSSSHTPFNGGYGGIKAQHLFTAAELAAAGISAGEITSVALTVTSAGTTYNGFTIQVGNTALTDFTSAANIQGGLSTVYSTASVTPTVGVNTYVFSNPFVWDGVSNIIVSFSWSNGNTYNTSSTVEVDPTANYSSQSYRKDNDTPANILAFTGSATYGMTSSQNRPKMTFEATPVCSSARTEVIATVTTPPAITVTATPAIICLNDTTSLEVTSSNAGYTFAWEPGTMSGATQSVAPTGTTTYNVTAADNSGGANNGCVVTGSVLVTVNPIPTNVTITASDASICAGESVQLAASANSNTDEVINFTEGFEAWPPANWTFINNGTGNNWVAGTTSYAGTGSMKYGYNSSNAADAWAITPAMNMVAGTNYTISFWYIVAGSTFPEKLKVTVGNTASVAGQTTILWDNNGGASLTNTTYAQATIAYSPSASGTYYFGFNCYSAANMYNLFVDSLSISGSTLHPCTYTWTSVPAGFTSTDQTPAAFAPTATAQYIVTAENNVGCSASADTNIVVNPLPIVNLGTDQTICDTTTITLDAGNPGSTYAWSTGGTSQTEDILGADLGAGTHSVYVDVTTAAGCAGNDVVNITVTVCSGIEDPAMQISYYPNPATNMLNLDLSELPTGDYRFELLNMQGQKVIDRILINDGTVISVNLLDIAPGSYVISVSGNNNTFRNYLNIQE